MCVVDAENQGQVGGIAPGGAAAANPRPSREPTNAANANESTNDATSPRPPQFGAGTMPPFGLFAPMNATLGSETGTNQFSFPVPPMPYIPMGKKHEAVVGGRFIFKSRLLIYYALRFLHILSVPPPPPLLQTTGLTEEELRRMEGNMRDNIEARLQCLRNVQILLDSAVVQMQQYATVSERLK